MEFECKRNKFGYIILPGRFIHQKFGVNNSISFCVDTGTVSSIIMYEQAVRLKIPINQLQKMLNPLRVAGVVSDSYVLEDGELIIRDYTGKLHTMPFSPVLVQGDPKTAMGILPVPCLLGNDFISLFTFVIEDQKHGGRIYFTDQKVRT